MYRRQTKRFVANRMKGGSPLQAQGMMQRSNWGALGSMVENYAKDRAEMTYTTALRDTSMNPKQFKAARGQYVQKNWRNYLRG